MTKYSLFASDILVRLGEVSMYRGEFGRAEELLAESLEFLRASSPQSPRSLSEALDVSGQLALASGDLDRAREVLDEGLALARSLGHRERICDLLVRRAEVALRSGAHEDARRLLDEGLSSAREIEHAGATAANLLVLGQLLLAQGDIDGAERAFEDLFQAVQRTGARLYHAQALYGLSHVAARRSDPPLARARAREALEILQAIGHYLASEVVQWLAGIHGQ